MVWSKGVGQARARVPEAAYQQAREFPGSFEILCPEPDSAAIHGLLRARLLANGIQLSDPDSWIAAHALEHRLPLLTTDRVSGISPNWPCTI